MNYRTLMKIFASCRKGITARGKAEKERISYKTGISKAMSAFKDAQSTADPKIIILAECTFLNQEPQVCEAL